MNDLLHRIRIAAVFVVVGVSAIAGLYFGQDISAVVTWPALLSAAGLGLLAWLAAPPSKGASRGVALGLVLFAFTGAFVGGRYAATASFHEVTVRGEEVREALAAHRARHGRYPDTLDELDLEPMPGRRIVRENVMRYQRTDEGYRLVLEDWVVRVEATQDTAFPR